MTLIHPVKNSDGTRYGWMYHCPGCKSAHVITDLWSFDGNRNAPTISPSVKVTYPGNPNALPQFPEWKTTRICHAFVEHGMIKFLDDSTHHLAGKTVKMVDLDKI